MKYKILLIAIIAPFFALSQETVILPIDPDTKMATYQEVVQEKGTADELYIRGIEWINSFYKNPADVTRVRNRESGVIELLHRFEIYNMDGDVKVQSGFVNYSLKLEFKPGRYRYTVDDINWRQATKFPVEKWLNKADPYYSPLWDSYIQQVDTNVKEIIANLKKGMQPVEMKPEEKW
ncbi:MAG TPA: DUF4468 domain-containing protein [Lentimicrobium sp.]|nr:DUF4468 domain-containing protein [Lentimicrobium sp.]